MHRKALDVGGEHLCSFWGQEILIALKNSLMLYLGFLVMLIALRNVDQIGWGWDSNSLSYGFLRNNTEVDTSWQKRHRKSVGENLFPTKDIETRKINLNLLSISLTCTEEALIHIWIRTGRILLYDDMQLYSLGEMLGAKNYPFCFLFSVDLFPYFPLLLWYFI